MASFPEPQVGLVISYAYLWSDEAEQGQVEGRKDRPCAIVVATEIPGPGQRKQVAVVPITHAPSHDPRVAIEIPRRLNNTTPLPQQTQAGVNSEITQAQNAIIAATGIAPKRFRAPYGFGGVTGRVDPKIQAAANQHGLTVVYWDVDTQDTQKNGQGLNGRTIPASVLAAKALARRATNARPVNILMHVLPATAKGLPVFVAALKKAGFTFVDPPP